MAPTTKLWLDCDPGHDDAFAIILAAHHPAIELLGVSSVAGNQTVEKVTENAIRVLHAIGRDDIRVVQGQPKAIMRPPVACPEIHGESGLDGPDGGPLLPPCDGCPAPGKAALVMAERIAEALARGAGTVTIVAVGALTNIALLLTLFPELTPSLKVVFMGGAIGVGNTSPGAEFNIQIDPEAAAIVLGSGVDVTMVPLEVTHTALVTPAVLAEVSGAGMEEAGQVGGSGVGPGPGEASPAPPLPVPASAFRGTLVELLTFFAETYRDVFGFANPPLHDPCAVAYALEPELFVAPRLRVDVETASALSPGRTVVDVYKTTGRPPNCTVCTAMDVPGFWRLQLRAISRADAVSPLNGAAA